MPDTSRLLYYDLGMSADDDGFCEWYPILQMTGGKEQDMQVLQSNGFVQVFDKDVLVILDWKENNQIRQDRYQKSKHLDKYGDILGLPNGNHLATQVRLGKDSIGSIKGRVKGGDDAGASPSQATVNFDRPWR